MKKLDFGYGVALGLLALALVGMFLASGCSVTESLDTPYERGQAAAQLALLEFDDEGDTAKLMTVRDDITGFLNTNVSLEMAAVNRYSKELAAVLGVKERELMAFFLVLRVELLKTDGQARVRAFLEGARNALDVWLPSGDWALAPPVGGGV